MDSRETCSLNASVTRHIEDKQLLLSFLLVIDFMILYLVARTIVLNMSTRPTTTTIQYQLKVKS